MESHLQCTSNTLSTSSFEETVLQFKRKTTQNRTSWITSCKCVAVIQCVCTRPVAKTTLISHELHEVNAHDSADNETLDFILPTKGVSIFIILLNPRVNTSCCANLHGGHQGFIPHEITSNVTQVAYQGFARFSSIRSWHRCASRNVASLTESRSLTFASHYRCERHSTPLHHATE